MTRKLLLADNSTTIQRVIELTFAGQDVQVVAVADGDQAIARFEAEKPDIVLADIGVPKRNGYDIAAFVTNHPELSHVPVVLLAGAFEPVDEARAREVKSAGVIVKPFEPQQVISRVRELVGGGPPAGVSAGDVHEAGLPAAASARSPHAVEPDPSASSEASPDLQPSAPEKSPTAAEPPVPAPWFQAHEPELSRPEVGVASEAPADSSLDDYFDRLDAAFATLGNSTPAAETSGPPAVQDDGFEVPTMDELLAGGVPSHGGDPSGLEAPHRTAPSTFGAVAPPPPEPPDASPTLTSAPRPSVQERTGPGNRIAEAFNLLFAIEQGEADPSAVRVGPPAASADVSEELVDRVTRRVLERLAPDAARDVVAEIVSEMAERLVREEIARIKARLNS